MGGGLMSALSACATGADNEVTMPGFSSSGGGSTSSGSSSGDTDATTGDDSSSSGSGSSSGYGDDTSNPNPGDDSPISTGDDSGDDGGSSAPPGPTCTAGQACVDGIPSGWSGFVQLMIGASAGDAGAGAGCAAPYEAVQPSLGGQTNPDGGPATCGSCNCTIPDGGLACTVTVEGDNTGCIAILGAPPETTVTAGECTMVMTTANTGANGHVSTPSGAGATCTPHGGDVTTPPPPPTWQTAVACGSSDAGAPDSAAGTTCISGQACAAFPTGSDGGMPSGVCMYQSGIQTCPPSGTTLFTNTFIVGAVEDSRGCGCTCGAATCPVDGYVEGFTGAGCTGAPTYTFDAGAACNGNITNANRPKYVDYHLSRSGSPGTCGAATTGPTGDVDIDGGTATTFCCIP